MEHNGVGGGLYSGMGSGMLGLEMPLHQPQKNPQNHHQMHHQPQVVAYSHHDPDHHPQALQSVKHGYPFATKSKQITLSDEDEPGCGADDSNGDNKRKISPWQRMKWTDTMVRLLIMAVFYIGDEAGSDGTDPIGKKKSAGGLLQKKGKWKSVSRAMMEKGFYVSPQQCEDKFNDLNKRYKRVNDILGKGTACRVVENQGLLEKMDLSSKMKEEVRKLLNSKHLFFREMCAYHNSCGHGTVAGGASGAHNSPEMTAEPADNQLQQQQAQQQRCFHSSENAPIVANSGRSETEGSKMLKAGSGGEDEDEDYEDDDSEDEDDEEEDEVVEGGSRGQNGQGHEDDDDNEERASRKRPRKGGWSSATSQLMRQLSGEVMVVIQDGLKSPWEKRQWMKTRLIQLEEQQVSYQYKAFELEKQRLKWVKFSSKKERDMERTKLENERRRLENERMLLLVRQKELELLDLHHQQQQQQQQQNSSNKRSDPSSLTG